MMTANVVVIQPGSLYVRLGAGCDSSPVKVLHAIARRRTGGGRPYHDPLLVPQSELSSQNRQGLEQAKQQGEIRDLAIIIPSLHCNHLTTVQYIKL